MLPSIKLREVVKLITKERALIFAAGLLLGALLGTA